MEDSDTSRNEGSACDTKGRGCGCGTFGSKSSWLVLLAVGAAVVTAAWFIS